MQGGVGCVRGVLTLNGCVAVVLPQCPIRRHYQVLMKRVSAMKMRVRCGAPLSELAVF